MAKRLQRIFLVFLVFSSQAAVAAIVDWTVPERDPKVIYEEHLGALLHMLHRIDDYQKNQPSDELTEIAIDVGAYGMRRYLNIEERDQLGLLVFRQVVEHLAGSSVGYLDPFENFLNESLVFSSKGYSREVHLPESFEVADIVLGVYQDRMIGYVGYQNIMRAYLNFGRRNADKPTVKMAGMILKKAERQNRRFYRLRSKIMDAKDEFGRVTHYVNRLEERADTFFPEAVQLVLLELFAKTLTVDVLHLVVWRFNNIDRYSPIVEQELEKVVQGVKGSRVLEIAEPMLVSFREKKSQMTGECGLSF